MGSLSIACAPPEATKATPSSAFVAAPTSSVKDASSAAAVVSGRPKVRIEGRRGFIDDKPLAGVLLEEGAGYRRVDELFEALRSVRAKWKATHPSQVFPGEVQIGVSNETEGVVLKSVFQTCAYAGFPRIELVFGSLNATFDAQIPGPPCDASCVPLRHGYTMFALAAADRVVAKVPQESEVKVRTEARAKAVPALLRSLGSEADVIRVVAYMEDEARARDFGPRLVAVGAFGKTLPTPSVLSVRDFADTPDRGERFTMMGRPGESASTPLSSVVVGRLAPEIIQATVRANFGALRACYARAQVRDPQLEGRVVIDFTIQPDGTVAEARASGDLPASVNDCVQKAIADLVFRSPEPIGGPVKVTYPIVFKPEK
ncbi:MAG: AgmX/PglI C-terminal domain-containing protein [Myxococcota bacterium]